MVKWNVIVDVSYRDVNAEGTIPSADADRYTHNGLQCANRQTTPDKR